MKYQYDILGRRTKKVDSSKSTTNPESTIYIYSGDNILSEYKTVGSGSLTLKKNYINGVGTDNVIAYDVDESTNQGQISFCLNRVLSYSSEFTLYGYSGVVSDCNDTINSSTGIVTNRYYYHTNQLGSIIALTSSTGAVVQIYSYDSFGKVYVVNSGSLTSLDNYTGNTYSNTRLYTGREYDRETKLYYLRARYYNSETGRFISRDPIGQNDQVNLYTYVGNSSLMYVDRMGKASKSVLIIRGMETNNDNYGYIEYATKIEENLLGDVGVAISQIQEIDIRNMEGLESIFNEINKKNIDYRKIIIIGHGSPGSILFGEGNDGSLTIDNVKNLHTSSKFDTPIRLDSCNTGAGEDSIGELLAKQLGTQVIAPNRNVAINTQELTMSIEGSEYANSSDFTRFFGEMLNPQKFTKGGYEIFNY